MTLLAKYKEYFKLKALALNISKQLENAQYTPKDGTGMRSLNYRQSENLMRINRLLCDLKQNIDLEWLLIPQESSICQLINRYNLDRIEIEIILLAILREIHPADQDTALRGAEILRMVSNDDMEALRNAAYILTGNLVKEMVLLPQFSIKRGDFLTSTYCLDNDTVHFILYGSHMEEEKPAEVHANASARKPGAPPPPIESQDIPVEVIKPQFGFSRVVIEAETLRELRMFMLQDKDQDRIYSRWKLNDGITAGRGSILLLYGKSGVGKTLIAEAIAGELGRDLMLIKFSMLESCLMGDTEKNICRAFKMAKEANAMLLIDECDAIMNRRLSGNTHADRFFNQQLLVLTHELEQHNGVVVLTTNRAEILDQALDRRITLKMEVHMPDVMSRAKIWALHMGEAPVAKDVDFMHLAQAYPVSGGMIRNAVTYAARMAVLREMETGAPAMITANDIKMGVARVTGDSSGRSAERLGFRHSA